MKRILSVITQAPPRSRIWTARKTGFEILPWAIRRGVGQYKHVLQGSEGSKRVFSTAVGPFAEEVNSKTTLPLNENPSIFRLNPTQYSWVLDNNTNVTKVLVGPLTRARQDHETQVLPPTDMVLVPPQHYCIVRNPVQKDEDGNIRFAGQQAELKHGEEEVRLTGPPFPLYPGETLCVAPTRLDVVLPQTALHLVALRDHMDGSQQRYAGDEWHFLGPATYTPRVEVQVVQTVHAIVITPGTALKLAARHALVDCHGIERKAGEEWLVRKEGAYLPGVDEVVRGVVEPLMVTDKTAIHLRAARTFTDVFGKTRRAGEEWLLTLDDCEMHIPDVHELVVDSALPLLVLSKRQYCVIQNTVGEDGVQKMGRRELRRGEASFFLKPGEELEGNTIYDALVIAKDEAVLLRAQEPVRIEGFEELVPPGTQWTVVGPCEFIPPIEVLVLQHYKAIPLDEKEGVYVRNTRTGSIKAEIGKTFLPGAEDELWEKALSPTVEHLLESGGAARTADISHERAGTRDRTRVVSFRCPHNVAVQVYDYRSQGSRVVLGPGLVSLGPDEDFTVLSLSGGRPKRPNAFKSLCMPLGPEFMTDVVVVETSDHCRLSMKLAYKWHFDVEALGEAELHKIFQTPDFVGDTCKSMASRVRGAVAATTFDSFHKDSASIIQEAIFHRDEAGNLNNLCKLVDSSLVVSSVDIQSIEPLDANTREALSASVEKAISITTMAQEAHARHMAELEAQEAQGRLERQRVEDEVAAEHAKHRLLQLQAESKALETMGQAKAEATARAEAAQIEMQNAVELAHLKAKAAAIAAKAAQDELDAKQAAEVLNRQQVSDIETAKAEKISQIEVERFRSHVDAIGAETIRAMAQAGPEMQAKLLQGLGLSSVLITDGSNPVNLFSTANGLIAPPPPRTASSEP